MKTNKEKFIELVEDNQSNLIEEVEYRIKHRKRIRHENRKTIKALSKKLKNKDYEI